MVSLPLFFKLVRPLRLSIIGVQIQQSLDGDDAVGGGHHVGAAVHLANLEGGQVSIHVS